MAWQSKARDGLTVGLVQLEECWQLTIEREQLRRFEHWDSLDQAVDRARALGCDTALFDGVL